MQRCAVLIFLTVLLLVAALPALAAKPVPPPIEDLLKQRNQVAVMRVVEVHEQKQQITLERIHDLWGLSPQQVTLQAPLDDLASINPGQEFIVAYSYKRKHPMLRDVIEDNPAGPYVVNAFIAGPAVFENSVELRFLFNELQKDSEVKGNEVIKSLLTQIQQPHLRSRRLAVFEFVMRGDLFEEHLTRRHIKPYREILERGGLDAEMREFMLRASQAFPDRLRGRWIAEYCRRTIRRNGSQYDLASFVPLLTQTCVNLLAHYNSRRDIKLMEELLYSNNPGVAKAALRFLVEADEKQARTIASRVFTDERQVHEETRRVLKAYLDS